ncbi:unnamed protein product [Caenorhabditis nigoni]
MPFPILRTPFVVLPEIISLLEPNEIVTASFCSKKVKRLLKCHHQRRKPLEWKLLMIGYDCWARVDIATSTDDEKIPVLLAGHISALDESERKLIGTNGYRRGFGSEYPVLFFENLVMGSKMIGDYVTDLFNLDIYELSIDRNGIRAIDWISNQQGKMLQCFELVSYDNYNRYEDEALDYALRKALASDYHICNVNVSDSFRFDGKLGPANHLLVGSYGHWVTLDNLLKFDFIDVIIKDSRLSVSDLHSLLRHWRAGGSHRLTSLILIFKTDTIIENFHEDLETIETDEVVKYRSSSGQEIVFDGGYSIQRNDGVKAFLKVDIRHFVMIVLPRREII